VWREGGTHVLGSILAGIRGAAGSGQDRDGTVISDGFMLVGDRSGDAPCRPRGDIFGRDPHQ